MGLTSAGHRKSAGRWNAIRQVSNSLAAMAMVLAVSGCGGSDGGGSGAPVVTSPSPSPTPTPTPTSGTCSLSNRQAWVKSALDEWYLFPDLLASNVTASNYSDVQSYIDALVAPARAESKDRYFTYLTSIAEEEAYYNSGSTAGFGIRLARESSSGRLFLREAFENAPGYAAGMDRGTEILAIGTSASNLVDVSGMSDAELSDALGASDAGVTRVIRFQPEGGSVQTETVAKAEYDIEPLSPRYGAVVLTSGSKKIGYINLRTFIEPAENALRSAFADFKAQGVSEIIVDVRYNGGGLVQTAQVFSQLMNKANVGKEFSTLELRPSKSSQNDTWYFESESNSITATKVAFIGTGSSASASELLMNAQIPYSGSNSALIGSNTYGKPVGQYAFDLDECDDRLRAVVFRTVNADGGGDYYTGMASVMPRTCRADDDIFTPLGTNAEASIASALGYLAGGSCTAISAGTQGAQSLGGQQPIWPSNPTTAQLEMPGLF